MKLRLLILLVAGLAATRAQVVVFSDNMDNFPSSWVLERPRGTTDWTRMSDRYHTASYSAKCCPSTQYPNSIANRMTRYFDLSGFGAARLKFWRWIGLESSGWDTIRLQFHSATGWYTVWEQTSYLEQWRADSFDVPVTVDGLRFHFGCNDQLTGWGVYVDDVELTGYLTDVGVTNIIAPTGRVDSGIGLVPRCSTYNYANITSSYWALCRIGSAYRDSVFIAGHLPGTYREVAFPVWADPGPRGPAAVVCSTMLAFDCQPANNRADTTCRVAVHDIACDTVIGPPTVLDSGYAITPRAIIRNLGTEPETTFAWLTIGSFYSDTRQRALAAGESVTIDFATRMLTGPRGPHTVRCTTLTARDRARTNDLAVLPVSIRVHDVGAVAILNPGATVDSGTLVDPSAQVRNHGTAAEDFNCVFRIGTTYCDTQQVLSLPAGQTRTVNFASWFARPGSYTKTCSTMLNTDLPAANDAVRSPLLVRYVDLGISRILAPHTQILPDTVRPMIEVTNYGNTTVTNCPVELRINPGYQQTVNATLAPGQVDTLVYPLWNATVGTYRAVARHSLAGDMNTRNDSLAKIVLVTTAIHHDVGVTALLRPDSVTNPGNISPVVRVFNYGNVTEAGFAVALRIEDAGGSTVFSLVDTFRNPLGAGVSGSLTFPSYWLASTGRYTVKSWTLLPGDEQRGNDTVVQSVLVALHSVCPLAIVTPADSVGAGYPLRPRLQIRNRGSVTDSFRVHLLVERLAVPVYRDSARCVLAPGETALVTLPAWTPAATGDHQSTAWSYLPGDARPDDDTIWNAFSVTDPLIDAAAASIVAPSGLTPPGPLNPRVMVRNDGNIQASFRAALTIRLQGAPVYQESSWVDLLGPGDAQVLTLPLWDAPAGDYRADFVVRCAGDINAANDSLAAALLIRAVGRWAEKTPVPAPPSSRPMGKGGAITALAGDRPGIYAVKGNKSGDCYRYSVTDSSWTTLAAVPLGTEGKQVGDGGALTGDAARFLYATKGNNTAGFWRYDARDDSWSQRRAVPMPPSNKRVKGGASLTYAEHDGASWVYLLKGNKTDFYRYSPLDDTWYELAPAPAGTRPKWDKGSWLVFDGDHTVYAHKAKYHELWAYDTDKDTWQPTPLPAMPTEGLSGRKKSKEGGCAVWGGGIIYALKGGNSQEFWVFSPAAAEWSQLETIPAFGSTGKKKKVKAGSGLAYADAVVWATKGNKTLEFWRYAADPGLARPRAGGVAASGFGLADRLRLDAWPSPAQRTAPLSLRFAWPGSGPARLIVYDAAGRSVFSRSLARRSSSLSLDLETLRAGIYFVRLEAGPARLTRKLVIE